MPLLRQSRSNEDTVEARAEMMWLILMVAIAIVGFYLRFLWAITSELNHLRRKRLAYGSHLSVIISSGVDPADLRIETLDGDSPRIKDIF